MRRTPLARGDKVLQRNKPLRQRSNRPGAKERVAKDEAWSLDVRNGWDGRCVMCGRYRGVKNLHAHHGKNKSGATTYKFRWHWAVGFALCPVDCHLAISEGPLSHVYDAAFAEAAERQMALGRRLSIPEIQTILSIHRSRHYAIQAGEGLEE